MNMDDTYLRRYIRNLSIKIKYRQNPNLICLFRHTDVMAYNTPHISSDEAFESQRIRQLQVRHRDTITRLSAYIEMRDPLTLKEMRQIRRHTRVGAGMIMKIDFLRPAVPYVLYHHERYDGRGYPFRLSGKDIPVEGRILAVADTFEALRNVRPYRKAMSSEQAIEELGKLSGSQLDPDVVSIFTELMGKREVTV